MGTDCQVLVVGPGGADHVANAEALIGRLERLWSRFDQDSEVSRLGRADGETVTVTAETFSLVEKAVLAWQMTDGRFDPTMAYRMEELGYGASFETIGTGEQPDRPGQAAPGTPTTHAVAPPAATTTKQPAAGCGGIMLSRRDLTVRLPAGVGFDPGGIGKGLAADIVSKALIDNGAWGVLVNLGGDLRVRGTPPSGEVWVVTIVESSVADRPLATVALTDAGLATSTTKKRRWTAAGAEQHHLLDPTTGRPLETAVDLVSAIAGEAWWAEAAATALIGTVSPAGRPDAGSTKTATPPGCAALRVHSDGTTERLADFEGYET